MNSLAFYFNQSLPGFILRRIKQKHFEKYRFPKLTQANIDGVLLAIGDLSPGMKRIILSGGYEAAELAVCKEVIKPGERILELGAAIGCVGLFCLMKLKAARVVSVEPTPSTVGQLRRNYALNGFEPHVIEAAVAGEDGTVRFRTTPDFWTDSTITGATHSAKDEIEVNAMTLASILAAAKDDFTAMLIDIEGAETLISWSTLPETVKTIVLEIHPDISGVPKAFRAINNLLNEGFQVIAHRGDVFGLVRS